MFERVIVLPVKDNEGKPLYRQINAIRQQVLDIAGGYSEMHQKGEWKDGEEVFPDRSVRLSTIVDARQDAQIVACLPEWCASLRQLSLYTHVVEVEVQFVEPARATA